MKKNKIQIQKKIGLTIFFCVLISIIGAQAYLDDNILSYGKNESKTIESDKNSLHTNGALLSPPTRTYPLHRAHVDPGVSGSHLIKFTWLSVTGALTYNVELIRNYDFSNFFISAGALYLSKSISLYDGVYHWRIQTINSDGEYGSFSSWWLLKVGIPIESAPSLISPTHLEYITENSVQLQWSSVPLATNYWILYSTYQDFRTYDSVYTSSTTHTLNNLQDDTYYWKVSGEHDLSIRGPWSYAKAFIIDTIHPDVPILTSPSHNAALKDNTPTLSWQAVSEMISTYEVCVYDSLTSKIPVWRGNIYYYTSISVSNPLSDRIYYWKVRAEDKAGNIGGWSQLRSFTIDTIAPKTFVELNGLMGNNGWYVSDVSTTLSALDGGSGVDSIFYSSDNVNWFTYVNPFNIPFKGEGTIYYKSIDKAGNYDITQTKFVKIDISDPKTSINLDGTIGSNGWYRSPVLVTLTASDIYSGIALTEYKIDGSSWTTYTGEVSISKEGETIFSFKSTDLAGNIEVSESKTIKIDTIRPEIPLLDNPDDGSTINVNTPTLQWHVVSDALFYDIILSDTPNLMNTVMYTSTTNPFLTTIELPDGVYYWRVAASDAAGSSLGSEIWSFTVDTTPPITPTLLSPSMDSVINDDTVTFKWNDIADAVEYGIQVGINPDFSSPIIDTTLTDVQYTVSDLCDGDYYWRVNAKDDAGNWCSWSSYNTFTVDAILSIYIDDDNIGVDWSWAVNQWWCSGSGIETDPYVIKDITINAENFGSGIEIRNSDVYFVIENCDIHGSGSEDFDGGIYLYNTNNGKIINNNCSFNNNYGIHLDQSNDNTILDNIVSDNLNGIRLYISSYNTILKNTIENNRFDTCYLDGSSNNIVSNNYAFDNTYGFGMYLSSYNTFTNNIAMEISYSCYFLTDSSYNTFINNTASGKDFLSDGFYISKYSNNNNFTGNKALNNALRGFFLSDNAYDNTFSENIVNGEGITNVGFWLNKVSNNLIFHNDITGTSVGIMIWDYSDIGGFDNIIWGNNFTGNELHAQDDGINNLWDNGILGNYWGDYSGLDYNDDGIGDSPYVISGSAGSLDNYPIWDDGENTPIGEDIEFDDPISGISIKFSDITESGTTSVSTSDTGNDPPSGFSVSGQYYDITTTASYSGVITIAIPYNVGNPRLMHWSAENGQWEDITTCIDIVNKIIYGNISSLSEFAIMTGMSPPLYIGSDFTFTEDIYGPIIVTADNIVIDGNGFKLKGGGTGTGFYLNGRTGVTIKNVALERWTFGFHLYFSDFNTLTENTVTNGIYGFYLYHSSHNSLLYNTANQNKYIGFYLRFNSKFNVLTYNTATENYEAGFHLLESSDNNFLSDNIASNNGHGFYLRDSNYNAFLNNIADGSKYSGFQLTSSSFNIFLGNNASNANYGFSLGDNSNSNILAANTIKFNWGGIFIRINPYTSETGSDNLIYHNNFIDNLNQARDGNAGNNYWYNPDINEGNYWSDYTGEDADGDGIGDTPKYVWGGVVGLYTYDLYPFIYEKSWISIDSDNDGILDVYEEVIYGTDPLDTDTDDDGLWDGEEILNLSSDPLNYMDPMNLPIFIDGDATGVGAHNWTWALKYKVCTGSGTLNDPYIIENFQIITSSSTGIHIIDSSEYFIIRNCYIEALSYGIYIDNVADGTAKIINNTCRNVFNEIGISLWSSAYAEVINNTCINCIRGIMIGQSPYSAIINNTCKGGNGIGIGISQSDYSKVANNTCNNNYRGIYITSSNCQIVDNICNNNFKEGIYMAFYGLHGTSYCIVSNNYLESNGLHGIYIEGYEGYIGGSGNIIHHNIFIDNNPSGLSQAQDDGSNNQWDDGTVGNYWDDYLGVDFDDDGIGDTPNIIPGTAGSQDNYPIWDDGNNTPVGGYIEFNDQDSGITLIFDSITSGGTTKISIQDIGPDPPSGFLLTGTYYDISTTASFAGTIEIAIPYDETLVKGNEKNLKLKHWDSESEKWIDVTTWVDTEANIIYGKVESLSIFALFKEITLPSITVETPGEDQALQDGIVFSGKAEDESRVIWVNLTIREDDGANGIFIHDDFENMPAIYNEITKEWQLFFDTTELPDGYYMLIVEASDIFDQIGLSTTSFSIRNWAILVLLPSTEQSNPGRTMPVKYSLRVAEAVDPNTPFVLNEELSIVIYAFNNPEVILQLATFGDDSLNYRIDSIGELYITNFKTLKTPEVYIVEIWRKGFLIGSFTFETVDKKADTSVDTNYDWIDGSTLVFSAGIAFVNISIIWIPIVFLASIILWRKRNKKYNN